VTFTERCDTCHVLGNTKTRYHPHMRLLRTVGLALVVAVLGTVVVSCGDGGSGDGSSLTVYSGRTEDLIGPLLEQFSDETGIDVEVRYGDSAELALLLQTEGSSSPADVFISQSPGALGLLAGEGMLAELPDDLTGRVSEGFAGSDHTWVGITGRVRVLVYNKDLVDPADLPQTVLDLAKDAYSGRVAVAPTNGSFQDFVTAMRSELGDQVTVEWLEGLAANQSPNYPKNSAIVEAVARGEVEMGLVNHYYNLRALEADPALASVNYFFPADDVGSLVIVTGGSVLASSDSQSAGEQLLAWLLSEDVQATFVTETQEYSLLPGAGRPEGVPELSGFAADTIDYDVLGGGLTATIEIIRESGIER
jgi:iron(III) transport system substrate-binding protein